MAELPRTPTDTESLPRVLIVDDDRKFVRLLSGYLVSHELDVGVAYDGAEALAMARATRWDIIVLDVMLPRIDGVEILRQLRTFSPIAVLMLTGRGAENDQVIALEAGADDYLPKTSSARHVLARIRALLRRATVTADISRRASDMPQERIVAGSLQLDPEARRARLGDRPIALTAVEFDLLAYLMSHGGRVRTREQIMAQVQDRRYEMFARSVDMHISSLRRKLGELGAAHYIQTVRGVGYLFEANES